MEGLPWREQEAPVSVRPAARVSADESRERAPAAASEPLVRITGGAEEKEEAVGVMRRRPTFFFLAPAAEDDRPLCHNGLPAPGRTRVDPSRDNPHRRRDR